MRRMTYPRQWGLASSSIRLATFPSIVVTLILIAPIAFASPPDPSWIAGIYDGADGDDVVTLVYETAGVEAVSLGSILPLPRASNVSLASGPGAVHGFPLHQFTRGPPSPSTLMICDVRSRLHGFPLHQFTRGPPSPSTLMICDVRSRLRQLATFHAHDTLRSVAPSFGPPSGCGSLSLYRRETNDCCVSPWQAVTPRAVMRKRPYENKGGTYGKRLAHAQLCVVAVFSRFARRHPSHQDRSWRPRLRPPGRSEQFGPVVPGGFPIRSQRPTPLLVQPQGHRKGGDNGIQKYADTRHPHAGRGLRNPGALTERGTSFGMGGLFEKWPAPSDEGMPRVHGPRR